MGVKKRRDKPTNRLPLQENQIDFNADSTP